MSLSCALSKSLSETMINSKSPQRYALLFGSIRQRDILLAMAQLCEQEGLTVHIADNDVSAIDSSFDKLKQSGATLSLVVHGGGDAFKASALNTPAVAFETAWRSTCFSGAITGQRAMAVMKAQGSGTLIFLGQSRLQSPDHVESASAVANAGLRSFAQSMAREFGPQGVHVIHVLLQGAMKDQTAPDPKAVARTCWQLHLQHHSTWTHELDMRPGGGLGI